MLTLSYGNSERWVAVGIANNLCPQDGYLVARGCTLARESALWRLATVVRAVQPCTHMSNPFSEVHKVSELHLNEIVCLWFPCVFFWWLYL